MFYIYKPEMKWREKKKEKESDRERQRQRDDELTTENDQKIDNKGERERGGRGVRKKE